MKKDTVVPFEARPAVRPEERGQRAVDRQVAEVVEICKAMKSGEGPLIAHRLGECAPSSCDTKEQAWRP